MIVRGATTQRPVGQVDAERAEEGLEAAGEREAEGEAQRRADEPSDQRLEHDRAA